jgi:hypothetical protein
MEGLQTFRRTTALSTNVLASNKHPLQYVGCVDGVLRINR